MGGLLTGVSPGTGFRYQGEILISLKAFNKILPVFRFSEDKLIAYLRRKVERLARPSASELSRTITRGLARDGLMEDGREERMR